MTAALIINNGKHKGRTIQFPPDGILVIGRDTDCHLRLASTDVSRKHCKLTLSDSGIVVNDLGSRNGTFIDGYLISDSAPLVSGATLRVGNMEFRVPGERVAIQPQKSSEPFDEDIAAWLTEEGVTDKPNLNDSTIIPETLLNKPEQKPLDKFRDFSRHPHAQRAAEIIKEHWSKKPT